MMKYKRITAVMLCFVMLMSVWIMQVSAKENTDITEDITFTVEVRNGIQPIVGAEFLIYRLGEVNENGEILILDEFAKYLVEIKLGNDSALRNTALTLESYVLRDGVSLYDKCKTDANGKAVFPNGRKSLEPGVYLVIGKDIIQNNIMYFSSPFITVFSSYKETRVVLNCNFTAAPKYETPPVDETKFTCKIVKVWDDERNADKRHIQMIWL